MCGCLGGSIPVARPFLLRSAPINKRDTSPYKRRSRRKGAGSTSRAWRNPTRGEEGVGAPPRGHPGAGMGIWRRCGTGSAPGWCVASSRPPFPCPWPPAPSGCLSVGFSLSVRFGAVGAPKPLIPQILGWSRAGAGGSEAQPCVTGTPSSRLPPTRSLDHPRGDAGAVPCPNVAWGGSQSHPPPYRRSLGRRRAEPQGPMALAEANQGLPNSRLPF